MKNINTEKLIQYINDWAEQSEKQADKWGADGYFSEAHKDQVIAEFLREDLVRGIEIDLMNEESKALHITAECHEEGGEIFVTDQSGNGNHAKLNTITT
jgi:hypothetical protein